MTLAIQTKTLTIEYFALFREWRGLSHEDMETQAKTPEELYDWLVKEYSFQLSSAHVRVAVNGEFSAWNSLLHDGDTVVFIPPVAGG